MFVKVSTGRIRCLEVSLVCRALSLEWWSVHVRQCVCACVWLLFDLEPVQFAELASEWPAPEPQHTEIKKKNLFTALTPEEVLLTWSDRAEKAVRCHRHTWLYPRPITSPVEVAVTLDVLNWEHKPYQAIWKKKKLSKPYMSLMKS